MALRLELVDGYEVIEPGSEIKIQANDPDHPNKDFTLKIHRRLSEAPRSPTTDPVVDQTVVKSDDTGSCVFLWRTNDEVLKIMGPDYRYYPSISIDGGPQNQAPQPVGSDLVALDKLTGMVHELVISLGPIMAIPVYAEVSKDSGVSSSNTTFDFTWDNWQSNYTPVVFTLSSDSESLKTYGTDYTVDFRNGKVIMNQPVPGHVEVEASYVFGYFSNQELLTFMNLAMNDVNYIPPYTSFTLRNFPPYWRSIIISGAVLRCLEQVFMAPIFRERRLIFSDEDLSAALSNYYDRVKSAFELALTKKNRWSLVAPRGVSGHDVIAPPRVSAHNFTQWAYLRGRGF